LEGPDDFRGFAGGPGKVEAKDELEVGEDGGEVALIDSEVLAAGILSDPEGYSYWKSVVCGGGSGVEIGSSVERGDAPSKY
jgi:hypothetical protein